LQQVSQIRGLMAGMPGLMDALASGDEQAMISAAVEILRGSRIMYETQLRLAEADLEQHEEGSVTHYTAQLDRTFFGTGARLIDAGMLMMRQQRDPGLTAVLNANANAIDTAVAGMVDAARARKTELEATAAAGDIADAELQSLNARIAESDRLQLRTVTLWRDFAQSLRTLATRSARGPINFADLRAVSDRLGPMREELDEIAIQQFRVLARQ
jgi:hypothetical protein